MKRFKKIVALTAALVLVIGTVSTVSAASWKSYLGLNAGWYEGVEGKVTKNTDSAWTVKVQSIGWGGCYGGQMSKKISVKKGTQYKIQFNISSSKMDKWVWVKIGNETGSQMVFGKWLDCKKGKTVTVNETFTAKYNSDTITFGIGGDFYDRQGVATDKDAKVRYKYAPNKKLDGRLPSDYSAEHPTIISLTGFSFSEATASSGNSSNNNVQAGSTPAVNNGTGTVNTVAPTDTTVATGDFTPVAFGAVAVIAAAAVVVFTRRRESE